MHKLKTPFKKQSAAPTPSSSSQSESGGQAELDAASLPTVEEAKAKLKHSKAYDKLMGVCRGFLQVARVVEPCLESTPFKAVASVIIIIAEAIATVKDTRDGADALFESLSERLTMAVDHFSKSHRHGSQDIAEDFIKDLARDAMEIDRIRHASNARVLDSKHLKSELEDVVKRVDRAMGNFSMRVLLQIERDTKHICDRLMNGSFDRWNRAPAARFKADTASLGYTRQACTEGTRVNVLNRIYRWATDTSSPPIFWLSGMAGSGKSTIAYTVCKYFSAKNTSGASLGASFFCSRQVEKLRRLGNVVPTIAYQLARHSRLYAQALERVDPDVVDVPSEQVEKLLLEPWAGFANQRADELPLNLIVIDALDEIEEEGGAQLLEGLIDTIHKLHGDCTRKLKILVTSRPHPRIVDSSKQLHSDTVFRLEDIEQAQGRHDILKFLVDKLPRLANEHPELLDALADRADGLFIYAATVVRVLCPSESYHRLSMREQHQKLSHILRQTTTSALPSLKGIHDLYKQVLLDSIPEEHRQSRLPILRRIIFTLQPLPVEALARLADVPCEDEELDAEVTILLVQELHSVLHVSSLDNCVYVYHKSFLDFMLDDELSGLDFACDTDSVNAALSRGCFRIMQCSLHFNMCNLPSSYLLDSEVPNLSQSITTNIINVAALEYTCRYWTSHVIKAAKSSKDAQDLEILLLKFIDEHGLFWVEVINLLEAKATCLNGLRDLVIWVVERPYNKTLCQSLKTFTRVARSFFHTAASSSTPHLYLSCLATEIGIGSNTIGNWRARFSGLPRIQCRDEICGWRSALTQIKVGVSVSSVAFSFDGLHVVSGCHDRTVRIWDASTGVQLRELKGHTSSVHSAAFSPDGTCIVSGSQDCSVRIWNALTGERVHWLKGHTEAVRSVAFSYNGSRIVSGSDDCSVRIWDTSKGVQVRELKGHISWVLCVAFSPDEAQIVSGSDDFTVRVWNALAGIQTHELRGHTSQVHSVAFSSSVARVVSGSDDGSVRIWDTLTGVQIHRLDGHTDPVFSIAFSHDRFTDPTFSVTLSHDGLRAVSSSYGHSVRIWDTSTGVQVQRLVGHTDWVSSVAFSHDGQRVVSSAMDRTIRLWDISTEKQIRKPTCHRSYVASVAFSSDGTLIVSGSGDKSVCIWDVLIGEKLHELNGHTDTVECVAFSPNASRVVSGSRDRSVRVWDLSEGRQLFKLDSHTNTVRYVAFSLDGALVKSICEEHTMRIWDMQTGALLSKSDSNSNRTHYYSTFACSNDKTRVVLCPDNFSFYAVEQSLHIYDISTSVELLRLDGHRGRIASVAFSPDDRRLVSGSADRTVCVWDALTGLQLHKFVGHEDTVSSVTFSPDGNQIVSGSDDCSIRIWDVTADHETSINWSSNEAGWIVSVPDNQRLIWLPESLHPLIRDGRNCRHVISQKPVLLLDLQRAFLGSDWAKCYQPM